MSDPSNTQGTPGVDEEADTASGGAPEQPDESSDQDDDVQKTLDDQTTDDEGAPLENPSGG
ncbi:MULTISPECIES: hypothetical protein [unclassified Microbacterium]|uniref:hypothetical protein n=1 Tax=unclassified Microbacterium TaxID=2609290 RepID=UPI0034359256